MPIIPTNSDIIHNTTLLSSPVSGILVSGVGVGVGYGVGEPSGILIIVLPTGVVGAPLKVADKV